MEPAEGIEPTTSGLQNRCSAPELRWLEVSPIIAGNIFSSNGSFPVTFLFELTRGTHFYPGVNNL